MIREANHCIYIENQFCEFDGALLNSPANMQCGYSSLLPSQLTFSITTTAPGNPVKNLIGAAIVERIVSAAKAGRPFKVFVFMPELPAFVGFLV